MANLEWEKLRHWNGSQQNAFEELCCQLARCEQVPSVSHFVRKGTPDGGVECFWHLPDGIEHGWQAKFFLSPLTSQQWAQLDKSVLTALVTHPQLRKYIICIPQDRSDGRIAGRHSFLESWNTRVDKWKRLRGRNRPPVDFEYWGTSELFHRLTQATQAGRALFWFGTDFLDANWCRQQVARAVADAGDRYTPSAHVHLPIQGLFDAVGYAPEFVDRALHLLTVGLNRFTALQEAIRKSSKRETLLLLEQVLEAVRKFCAAIAEPKNFERQARELGELLPRVLTQIRTAREMFHSK